MTTSLTPGSPRRSGFKRIWNRGLREARRAEAEGDWIRAGGFYEQEKDWTRALECYETAQDYHRCSDLCLRVVRKDLAAKYLLRAGEKKSAASLLDRLGRHRHAAEIYLQAGSSLDAASAFAKAGEHLEAANIYLRCGDYVKAGDAFERGKDFLRAGKCFERQLLEARAEGRFVGDSEQTALTELSIRAARSFEKAGELERAASVLEGHGQNGDAAQLVEQLGEHRRAAELYHKAGRLPEAAALYSQVGDERASSSLQAEHQLSLGNMEEAAAAFLESGDSLRAGEAFEASGHFDRAADCYAAIEAYFVAGRAAFRAGDKDRTASLYEKAGQFDDAAALCLELKQFDRAARLFARSGRFFDAAKAAAEANSEKLMLDYLQSVPPDCPEYRLAVVVLARAFIRRGWSSLAIQKLEAVLGGESPNPDNLELWDVLAEACEDIGDLEGAARLVRNMMTVQYSYRERHARILEKIQEQKQRQSTFLLDWSITSELQAMSGPRYVLENVIGEGGMGAVYKAQDRLLGRPVAYKVLSERLASDSRARARFLKEARAAAALNHPNIITVFDIGYEDNRAFISMELIDGDSYAGILHEKKRLEVSEVLHLLVSVCQGLDHAHRRGIVHRDLKPSNILRGADNQVKIVDFGLAQPIETTALGNGKGARGLAAGTPMYVSPEQARGQETDGRSDIYSLGASLYELLVGQPPFTDGEILMHHIHSPVPALRRSGRGEIPPDLEELVLQCLAKEPSDRFQSAGEIVSFASESGLL